MTRTLDLDSSRALVRDVLAERWASGIRPVLGSSLKLEVLRRAQAADATFDERSLGYRNFLQFLEDSGLAEVTRRGGTDIALAPHGESVSGAEVLGEGRPRIRPEFWNAFVRFPHPMRSRAYDPASDRVIEVPTELAIEPPLLRIDPIPRETQLRWRREFAERSGDGPLVGLGDRLEPEGGFSEFSRALDQFPELRREWNGQNSTNVWNVIREWAAANEIADSVWIERRDRPEAEAVLRGKVYRLLDRIPAGRLLEIQIPVGWLVEAGPEGD